MPTTPTNQQPGRTAETLPDLIWTAPDGFAQIYSLDSRKRQQFLTVTQAEEIIHRANTYPELLEALKAIESAPFSMVNDSESLRHTLQSIGNTARAAITRATSSKE